MWNVGAGLESFSCEVEIYAFWKEKYSTFLQSRTQCGRLKKHVAEHKNEG